MLNCLVQQYTNELQALLKDYDIVTPHIYTLHSNSIKQEYLSIFGYVANETFLYTGGYNGYF